MVVIKGPSVALIRVISNNGYHATPKFFYIYKMIWFITHGTQVVGKDGSMMYGEEQILRGVGNVPDALELQEISGLAQDRVITDCAMYFRDEPFGNSFEYRF